MSRLLRVGIVTLLVSAAYGCNESPVGDPCIPESIPADGFDDREIYLETSSVQCRTRVCMVYKLDGHPDPSHPNAASQTELDQQVFCSCRCSSPTGGQTNTPLCNCGEGYFCEEDIVTTGGDGVRGGYCVPCRYPGDPRNLDVDTFENCPAS